MGAEVAQRRMFSLKVIDTDDFMDMPSTARLLYYDLAMRADDDGFVNSPKRIMSATGATIDDLKVLLTKKYVFRFESGICVIKHWKVHNYIRSDRYNETEYLNEKSMLKVENSKYELTNVPYVIPNAIPDVIPLVTTGKVRLGKDRKGKDNKGRSFVKPSFDDVSKYCKERNNNVDPASFIDFYESKGWMVGKNKMVDWKACVRTWEKRHGEELPPSERFKEMLEG